MSRYQDDLKKHKSLLTQTGLKGLALFEILEQFIPGFEGLQSLFEAQHREKVERYCRTLINASQENSNAGASHAPSEKVAIEYLDLFRAFLTDNDAQKAEFYARLTAVISGGFFDPDRRRHYISALRDLHAKDLHLLRKCFLVKHFSLIPPDSSESFKSLTAAELCSPKLQGELVTLSLSRLRNHQLFNDEGITKLGVEFTRATHHRDSLEPDGLGEERTWQSGHVVLVVNKEPSSRRLELIKALRSLRIRAELLPIERFSTAETSIAKTKALVFFEGFPEITYSQKQALIAYSSSHHWQCIAVEPFSVSGMSYRKTLNNVSPADAAKSIAEAYGFSTH